MARFKAANEIIQGLNHCFREMQADVKVTVFFRDLRCRVTESFVIGDVSLNRLNANN